MRDSKVIKDLIALAEGQGWTVIQTKNSHIRFMPKDLSKKPVVASGQPSTRRAVDNLKSQLKQAGLVFPDHAGRSPTQQERRLEEKSEELRQVVLNSLEHLRPTARDYAIIENAEADILALLSLLIADDGRIHLNCPCGINMHRLSGYMKHIGSCEEGHADIARRYAELDPEVDTVKRDMIHPPDRERLDCPDCPGWFWVSQPHLLEQHMAGEHGMKKCPYCETWHRMEGGQITKHVNSCDERPEGTPPVRGMVVPIGSARPPRAARGQQEVASTRPSPPVAQPPAPPPRGGQQAPSKTVQPPRNVSTPPPAPGTPPALQPFVWRRVGNKVTATTYHLYKDCGMVASDTPGIMVSPGDPLDGHEVQAVEHINVDETAIDLLGLRCCRACERRSKKISIEEMVTEWFSTMDEAADRGELALQFLIDLSEYGYKIVKGK